MALGRSVRRREMTPVRAGLLAIVVIAVLSFFGFTRANPFSTPFRLEAVFETAVGLKANSPVRVAGVDVGTVKKVEPVDETGAARVTMELLDKGLPIRRDARLKIRSRIFLEGNFFVEVNPGSPSSPEIEDGGTIPMDQTSAPVQLGDVLRVLKADTRQDLRTFLAEFSLKGLENGGADAFNRAIPFMEPAYRNSALTNDALLGRDPRRDLQRVLKGQQRVAAALTVDEGSLKDLVTNLNTTAGALASEDDALRASVPALRDTLRVGSPALASLNGSLPSLRAFAVEALPGVRTSDETIDEALPFIRQTRRLMDEAELQGFARQLRIHVPNLVRLNRRLVPLLAENRELASCTNRVLVPWLNTEIPSGEPENTGQRVIEQINRSFVGLAGESRTTDANGSWFRVQGVNPVELAQGEVQPAPPDGARTPPVHRPDVPCETQDYPDLEAPTVSGTALGGPEIMLNAPGGRNGGTDARDEVQRLVRDPRFRRALEEGRAAGERRRAEREGRR